MIAVAIAAVDVAVAIAVTADDVAVVRLLLCPKPVGHNHCKTTVITNCFINNYCC